MSLTLTIDQGNSAAKLALWDGVALVDQDSCHPLTSEGIDRVLGSHRVCAAIYCSVADDGSTVVDHLRMRGVPTIVLTHLTPLPLKLGYRTPHTLGRDRIAAAVGAWARHTGRDILVVDIGTAITYDRVTSDGVYVGGNIAPGPWMRLEALHQLTARLPHVAAEGSVETWGTDTPGAMRAGAVMGVVGEIGYYRSILPPDAVTVLTGGDARLVVDKLDFEIDLQPNLVSEGLNSILRYNETV